MHAGRGRSGYAIPTLPYLNVPHYLCVIRSLVAQLLLLRRGRGSPFRVHRRGRYQWSAWDLARLCWAASRGLRLAG
jgi:hypothetical protein